MMSSGRGSDGMILPRSSLRRGRMLGLVFLGNRCIGVPFSRIGMAFGLDIGGMGSIGLLGLRRSGLRRGIRRAGLRLWIISGRWMNKCLFNVSVGAGHLMQDG